MLIEITDNAFSCLEINKTYYIELKDYILNAVHDTKRLKYKLYRHRYFKTKSSKNETVIHEKLPGKKNQRPPTVIDFDLFNYDYNLCSCVPFKLVSKQCLFFSSEHWFSRDTIDNNVQKITADCIIRSSLQREYLLECVFFLIPDISVNNILISNTPFTSAESFS